VRKLVQSRTQNDEDQTTGKTNFDQRIRLAQGSHAHSIILKDLQAQKRKEKLVITILLIKQSHNQVQRTLKKDLSEKYEEKKEK
jgi:hypothetical protein